MTLEEFKSNASEIKKQIINRNDVVDIANGIMTIYSENLNKYLEEYACKNADELDSTLYYKYGIFLKIID